MYIYAHLYLSPSLGFHFDSYTTPQTTLSPEQAMSSSMMSMPNEELAWFQVLPPMKNIVNTRLWGTRRIAADGTHSQHNTKDYAPITGDQVAGETTPSNNS